MRASRGASAARDEFSLEYDMMRTKTKFYKKEKNISQKERTKE